jgi:hypothetical protein
LPKCILTRYVVFCGIDETTAKTSQIPTDATTEQRMIAGAVFGVLNEAWDKFKAENNL